ncbi:MAG: DegT/DnrJ/EryC1/StrS family aminotransferase, partial [Gaiellaceae bacterium]
MSESIPLASPALDRREHELVAEVLGSGRLALGPMIERFESGLAAAVDAPYAVAVSNGTAGLHLAVRMAEIGEGDEVITSPFSFVASANCALYEGARPVFVDIDPDTFNLDVDAVEAAITPRTRALLPIDIFGYPVELDPLKEIASKYGLALIQDACEALGARYRGRAVGSFGHPTVFAFYPNKQITTGEGGAIVVNTETEYRLAKSLSNQGRADSGGWLEHARLGFNYRMSELTAAVGVGQLEKLGEILSARASAANHYSELLAGRPQIETPHPDDPDHTRSWFVYVVKLASDVDRERVI